MSVNPDTIYSAILIAGLLTGPAYIILDRKRDSENDLKEREIIRKYMLAQKDFDESAPPGIY